MTISRCRSFLNPVMDESGNALLKGVSRSFYLTLRLLPAPMRGAAGLGYLLARTSDTLADSAAVPHERRLRFLEQFRAAVAGEEILRPWPEHLLDSVPDIRERKLLEASAGLVRRLGGIPEKEAALVREVVEIIFSGQTLDLTRFAGADRQNPVSLADDAALEDYTWRVAGCVGAFWTKLGFLTMGDRFSTAAESDLLELGIAYGKGLQLVNILRDVPADLAAGRCYLPVANPRDLSEILACHARWLEVAASRIQQGEIYAASLPSRRLRAATVLPAMIASHTLTAMKEAPGEGLQAGVKIPRSLVYRLLFQAFTMKAGAAGG